MSQKWIDRFFKSGVGGEYSTDSMSSAKKNLKLRENLKNCIVRTAWKANEKTWVE